MSKEQYHSDFEMGSDTDESDDNSIDHEDFYRPKNREPIDNTEVKLTLMQRARRRPVSDRNQRNTSHCIKSSLRNWM
ncbi:unnamed protein product [Schistosoma mattheei]|uniref:Uncharacterized protein n=1 Tax=Schistosoma mattheei TaxID=31246 RepID=A0AA85C1U3_9TREM|nr:unnamed protein product [Schistosoma mattheei]